MADVAEEPEAAEAYRAQPDINKTNDSTRAALSIVFFEVDVFNLCTDFLQTASLREESHRRYPQLEVKAAANPARIPDR
jgi:hypothetical protein